MKFSHSTKALFYGLLAFVLVATPLVAAVAVHDWTPYLFEGLALPAAYFLNRQAGKHLAEDMFEGISKGIDKGLKSYFESPKFPEAMDKAWTNSCASLAKEAHAVGQNALAAGYRALGGIGSRSPVTTFAEAQKVRAQRLIDQNGFLVFIYDHAMLPDDKRGFGIMYKGESEIVAFLKNMSVENGNLVSATVCSKDDPQWKAAAEANWDLCCNYVETTEWGGQRMSVEIWVAPEFAAGLAEWAKV